MNMKGLGVGVSIGIAVAAILFYGFGITPSSIRIGIFGYDLPVLLARFSNGIGSNTKPTEPPIENINLPGKIWETSLGQPKHYSSRILSDKILTDLTAETDVQFQDNNNEFHGIIVRAQDSGRFYSFGISSQGNFIFEIWKVGEPNHISILGPFSSSSIKTGKGGINRLKVLAIGSRFELSINEVKVGSLSDITYSSGKVGLVSCTCNGNSESSSSFFNFSALSIK